MKNKHGFQILAISLMLIMMLGMFPSAMAETGIVAPNDVVIDKYLIMDKDAKVPPITFNYTMTPIVATIPATGDTYEIKPGIGTATIGPAAFTPGEGGTVGATPTYNAAQDGDVLTKLGEGEKYAAIPMTVTFADATFTEPGVYRYTVKEDIPTRAEGAPADGITYDDRTLYLDVFVESDGNALSIGGTLLHSDPDIIFRAEGERPVEDDKVTGFENEYTTHNLTFSKTVTGNQGFRDKYFTFDLWLDNAVPGSYYTVDLSNADSNPPNVDGVTDRRNVNLIRFLDAGSKYTFFLKDAQSITINGLTEGTKYRIQENDYSAQGYTTSHKITQGTVIGDAVATSDTPLKPIGESNVAVEFTNNRQGVVPTGILLDIWPYLLIVAVAAVALIVLLSKKRKHATRY